MGAGLGLADAVLQTVTRNPLAEPELLGPDAGAAFAVVLCAAWLGEAPSLATLGVAAIAGAVGAGAVAFALADGLAAFGADPLRLILAGAVTAMALGSATGVILLLRPGAFEATQLWLAGSLADRPPGVIEAYLPWMAGFLVLGLATAPGLAALMLGEAQGRALGARTTRLRAVAVLASAGVTGLAVGIAGPVGFVELVTPHLARWVAGPMPRRLLGLLAAAGATLLLADVLARQVVAPAELPVGLLMAAVGVPFLLILLRRGRT